MAKTISNVLVGVAALEAGHSPSGAKAEWSEERLITGSHAIKLSKPATGNYGSTHVQITASGNAAAQTLADFDAQALLWGYSHCRSVTPGVAWWIGMELRFEDPNSNSWVDVTTTAPVIAGTDVWAVRTFAGAVDTCYYGGWSELDGSFSNWVPQVITGVAADVALKAPNQTLVTAVATWVLTRVRLELWETATERQCYVDDIVIDGVTYTLEPGAAATAGIRLGAPSTELGYTEDGVTMEYTADETDIEVDEETFPIDRALTKETVALTANLAEASLYNLDAAMAGSLLSGGIIKLGAGTNKKMELILTGTNPAGYLRQIILPSCTATGTVGTPYQKSGKTIVPVTFQALKTANNPAVTIVDNAL